MKGDTLYRPDELYRAVGVEPGPTPGAGMLRVETAGGETVLPFDRILVAVGRRPRALAGLEAGYREPRLYVGSWSEWIRDPARPRVGISD